MTPGDTMGPRRWHTGIILLNWNNPADTTACLQSILHLVDLGSTEVFIVDNGSTDDSVARLQEWSKGHVAERQGFDEVTVPVDRDLREASAALALSRARFHLIRCGENHLYSGGNNVGLRLAQATGRFDSYWLLNNDTEAHPEALANLRRSFEGDDQVGMAGSTLVYPGHPARVQALGGATILPWLASTRLIGNGEPLATPPRAAPDDQLDCIVGASMMISDEFLRRVGFLEEGFGMYFEEPDFGVRAREHGLRLAHAASSIVVHKEGGSVSPERARQGLSERQVEWATRSRLLFTWKHYPWLIPMGIAASIGMASSQAFGGRGRLAVAALRGLQHFLGRLADRKPMFTEGHRGARHPR